MRKTTSGRRMVSWELPEEAIEAIKALAAQTGRELWQEVAHALERHVAQPPTVTIVTPALSPASVERVALPPAVKRPRGRPRKVGG